MTVSHFQWVCESIIVVVVHFFFLSVSSMNRTELKNLDLTIIVCQDSVLVIASEMNLSCWSVFFSSEFMGN